MKERDCGSTRQSGSVTAELAVALPAVVVLLAALLLAVSVGIAQLSLEAGVRAGARAVARGDTSEQAVALAHQHGGKEASFSVGQGGEFTTVSGSLTLSGPFSALIPVTLTASATARVENVPAASLRPASLMSSPVLPVPVLPVSLLPMSLSQHVGDAP